MAGVATWTEIRTVMTLDDVILWHLYLDAVDEASIPRGRGDR
jgi:hypothetical protein